MSLIHSIRQSHLIKEFIKNIFGFSPHHLDLYKMALTHRSSSSEDAVGARLNNERLEYLGDAILGAVTADYLFRKYPTLPEGQLTEMRSKIVCRENLNALAYRLGFDDLIDKACTCRYAKSANGDAFEAVVGAIFLDKGFDKTRDILVKRILLMQLDLESLFTTEKNFKSKMLAYTQKRHLAVDYEHSEVQKYPKKLYKAVLLVEGKPKAEGLGFTIKQAEQAAAEDFCNQFLEE